MANPNLIVLDCETGGLNCKENPITQFAAIILDEKMKEINRFQTFVKPYNNLVITKAALDKTMVSMAEINKGIELSEFVEMVKKFAKLGEVGKGRWLRRPQIVGHNVPFDIGFMNYAFEACNSSLEDSFDSNNGVIDYIDTIKLARLKWTKFKSDEDSKYQLGSCCQRMGITLNDAHGAMNDVIATWKLLVAFSDNLSNENSLNVNNTESGGESGEEQAKARDFFRF